MCNMDRACIVKLLIEVMWIYIYKSRKENPQKPTQLSSRSHKSTSADPEVVTFFFTQMSMEFFLLINVKMPTTVGILIFMSRKITF